MNLFSLIAHLSLLIHLGKDIQAIAQNLIQHKENFPSVAEFLELIDDAIAIVGSGLIALPSDVMQKFVDALNQLKKDLQATAQPQPAI